MKDRFGQPLALAWSEVEILWLEAAISLKTLDLRMAAYLDISGMSGRSFAAVKRKALNLQMEKDEAAMRAAFGTFRPAPVVRPGRVTPAYCQIKHRKAVA